MTDEEKEDQAQKTVRILREAHDFMFGDDWTRPEAPTLAFTSALRTLSLAGKALVASIDPVESSSDEVAELILAANSAKEAAAELKAAADARVLEWLLENKGKKREIQIGDMKYFGEKTAKVRCKDMPAAGQAIAAVVLGEQLMEAVGQDRTRFAEIMALVRLVFLKAVSSDGLKPGAARELLGEGAARAMEAVGASREEVEEARATGWLQFFSEEWPDGLSKAEAPKKLGVANLRFVHRQGGKDAKYFKSLEDAQ